MRTAQLATRATPRMLERIQAKGLQPTAANVATVQRLLVRATDSATTIALVRLLGSMATPDWLDSVALLAAALGRAPYSDLVLGRLNDERTDPRKVFGFLTSSEGKRFMRELGHKAPVAKAADTAMTLAQQFPGHPVFTLLTQDLRTTLATLPE